MILIRRLKRHDCRGLTLLEVLIAIFMVSILAAEVAGFFARGRASILEEGKKRDAVEIAQGELERMEILPPDLINGFDRSVTVDGTAYDVKAHVTDDTPEPGMKDVQVSVDWKTHRGTARSIRVEAAYGNPR